MSAKAERYAEHVVKLADEHGVQVVIQGEGIGYRRERRVTIPAIRGQVTYLVALHELGHVVGPQGSLRLTQEAEAWRWALANSLDDLTVATWRSILRCLDSYARRQRHWKSMKRSDEFDAFHAEVQQIVGTG